jgi:hypothetical protein
MGRENVRDPHIKIAAAAPAAIVSPTRALMPTGFQNPITQFPNEALSGFAV